MWVIKRQVSGARCYGTCQVSKDVDKTEIILPLIKHFEDIHAWQEARKLSQQIYRLTQNGKFSKDYGLRDQIQRAAVSVMANIAEGFDCESKIEFARY